MFATLYVVFVNFLAVGSEVPFFAVYLLSGIVIWNYFSEVTNGSVNAIVGRGDLLRKINFPKYVIVLSGSISAFINLLINSIVISVFMYFSGVELRLEILLIPLLIAQLFILSLSVAFLLSSFFVKFRDVGYVWEVVMQAAFYATPILYPLNRVSDQFAKILILNPMAQIIQDIRYLLVTDQTITMGDYYSWPWRLVPVGITALVAAASFKYFRNKSPTFAENI